MYLHDSKLKEACSIALKNFNDNNVQTIAYDLTLETIVEVGENKRERKRYTLSPGETVFISSKEILAVPTDCIGFVTLRNSCIRMGLDLSAPVYYPGHETKVFVRVTNISNDEVDLKEGDSIVSLMLYQLDDETATPYQGKFSGQLKYDEINDFTSTKLPELRKIERKAEDIKGIEKSIYSNVITIMTIFIGIFSLLNLNLAFLKNDVETAYMVLYNFMMVTGVSILVSLISLIMSNSRKKTVALGIISVFLIAITLVLTFTI